MNDIEKQGEELNQLSRLLFNKASKNWCLRIITESIAGLLGILVLISQLSEQWNILFAVFGITLLTVAYFFRMRFEDIYNNAETMRRQSILTEALGWTINKTQFSEWRLRAGSKILKKFELKQRDENYYTTGEAPGVKRLLEMTIESAFWTRHLYSKIKFFIWSIFILSITIFFFVISILSLNIIPTTITLKIIYSVYLVLPLMVSIDILGWALKLNELSKRIEKIESDLERLNEIENPQEAEVLRLVFEYNCQVIGGFPIPNWFFSLKHNEIENLWKKRNF